MSEDLLKPRELTVDTMESKDQTLDQELQEIRFSQNDLNSAELTINITHKKELLDLTGKTVELAFKKSDKTLVYQENVSVIDAVKGKVKLILRSQTLAAAGKVIGQLVIRSGETQRLETQKFAFYVDESLMSDKTIQSTNDYPLIQQAIDAGKKLDGVDLPSLVASKETAEAALAKSTENTTQIGILNNVVVSAENFPIIAPEVDDTARLQRAVNSLKKGANFTIPKGSYTISNALNFNNKENITIEINGHIKQTKHGYCGIEIQTCNHVIVKGSGKIEGYGIFPSRFFDENNRESNEKTRNSGGFATNRKNGTAGTTAFGGGWEGNTGFGVLIYEGSQNVTVKELEIFGFNYGGVGVGWMGASTYNTNILVTNCTIHDCQDNGVSLCKTIGVTVEDNFIYNIMHPSTTINDTEITMGYGVTAIYSNSVAENILIKGNRIYKCSRKGIDFHAAKGNASAIGNEIKDCYVHGIATPHNTSTVVWSELEISHNRVINCGNAPNYLTSLEYTSGILFDATYGGILADNIVKDSGFYGIEVSVKSYGQTNQIPLQIINNFVSCTNSNNTKAINIGIYYSDVVLSIQGNTFKTAFGTVGLYCFHNSAINNLYLNISGNTFLAPVNGSSYGISLFQIADGSVSNNTAIGVNAISTSSSGKLRISNSNVFIGAINTASYGRDTLTSAFRLKKSSGSWTLYSTSNPKITATLITNVDGFTFDFSANPDFIPEQYVTMSFVTAPNLNPRNIGYTANSATTLKIITYDSSGAVLNPTSLADGADFFVHCTFRYRSI